MTCFRSVFLFSILTMAVACVTLPPQYKDSPVGYTLNPEAAHVHVVKFIPSADREKWDEVRMLTCSLGFNAQSAGANIHSCVNDFKNVPRLTKRPSDLFQKKNLKNSSQMLNLG